MIVKRNQYLNKLIRHKHNDFINPNNGIKSLKTEGRKGQAPKKKHRSEAMKKDITRFLVDDFLKALEEERKKKQIEEGKKRRKPTRIPGLTESEIATIVLMFQESPCRNFKYFYKSYLQQYRPEFPKMPSYERFVALIPRILYLLTLLFCCTLRKRSKIAYVDSTSLNVCHPKRIYRNNECKTHERQCG